jgi:DNA-binding protein YbaB
MQIKIDNKDQINKLFTKMFESSIKSAVNDSLAKIETTCVTALDKFCHQMDPSAYDEQ